MTRTRTRNYAMGLVLGMLLSTLPLGAQVAIPNTLVSGAVIRASDLNTNFSTLGNHSLDRLSGGNISGNVTLDSGITIDGIDLSVALCSVCAATLKDLTLATPASGLTVAGVNIINSSGKIPALTTTYFASLAFSATNLTSGLIPAGRIVVSTAQSGAYAAVAGDFVLATGTFTVTLPAASSNTNAVIDVKNVSTGVITVGRTGADTIDGATSQSVATQYQSMTFVSDGTNWWIK